MSSSVFAATMTLDGAPYLATSAKVAQATQLSEAQLKRLDAQVLMLTNAMRPLAAIAAAVQKQFELVRASTTLMAAANAPAQSALSATATALMELNSERATAGMSRTAQMLAAITSQADTAASSIQGLNQDVEGTPAAEEESGTQEKTEAETPAAPERPERGIVSAAAVAVGSGAGSARQVEELGKIEGEEKKVEEETKHVADAVDHLSQALSHNADEAGHAGSETHKAAEETKKAGDEMEKTGEKSKRAGKDLRDEAVGFRGLGEAAKRAAEMIRDVTVAMPEVAALVGIFAGVGEMASKIREAFTYGDQLNALSRQTGESATTLAQLRRTFEYFDVSADQVGQTLFMLQRSLGGVSEAGEPTAAAFGRLGLSIADLRKMDAGAQFSAIMAGLQRLPDQATRSATAMQIFGRSAMEVQAILNASPADFQKSMADAAEYAQVMGRSADGFEDIERKFFVFREQIETIFARIAAGLVPAVQKLLDLVGQIDFSKWGTAITNVMGIITNAIGNGDIGNILKLTLELAAVDAMKTIAGLFLGVAQAFNAAFTAIFTGGFWSSLATGFRGVAEAFGAALLEHLRSPIQAIQGAIDYVMAKSNAGQTVSADKDVVAGDEAQKQKAIKTLEEADKIPNSDEMRARASATYVAWDKQKRKDESQLATDQAAASSMTIDSYMQAAGKTDPTFYNKSKSQLQKDSDADVTSASSALASLKGISDAFKDGFSKAQVPGGMFDTSSIEAQYNAIIHRNLPPGTSPAAVPPGGSTSSTLPNFNYKMPDMDRLAKIGLFVGGSTATPGLTEARRTAAATEGSLKQLQILGQRLIPNGGLNVAIPRYL